MTYPTEPPTQPFANRPSYVPPTIERQDDTDRVSPEEPKRHPVAYVALVLSILALLLSLASLLSHHNGNNDVRRVNNAGHDCVTVPAKHGPDNLYCR